MNIKRHIFEFFVDHDLRLNHQPTRTEIRAAFASLCEDVDLHLEQLEREGLLILGRDGDGSVSLARTYPQTRRLNLRMGGTSRGERPGGHAPSTASIGLDLSGVGFAAEGDLFAQVILDGSMIDAGVKSGDVAILQARPPVRGEIVAVELAGRPVLRRYLVVAGIPHFLAENPGKPDLIPAYEHPIQGVLWCLICTNPNGLGRTAPPIKKISYQQPGRTDSESKFMAILNAAMAAPASTKKRRQERTAQPAKPVRKQIASVRKRSAFGDPADKWPKPPSGVELNDNPVSPYRSKLPGSHRADMPGRRYEDGSEE